MIDSLVAVPCEPCVVHDFETVQRYMFGRRCDCRLHAFLPAFDRLPGNAEHQIEAQIVDSRISCSGYGLCNLPCLVDSPQDFQYCVVKRLCADAEPVKPRLAKRKQLVLGYRCGVHFHAHFHILFNLEFHLQSIHESLKAIFVEKSGRSAAEVNAFDWLFGISFRIKINLVFECCRKGFNLSGLRTGH